MTSGYKDIGIETLAFVTIELNSFLVCYFIQCYLYLDIFYFFFTIRE